ncbi:ATPase [uncultured Bacteroides sp.]|uniref:AAA family ATPase n=1 Tax=uncultured Bacteroides sp. TaxID=162156 RepID=UPI002AA62F72|nr:ATPase [uncultured Bacteroides sp.]
MIRNPFITSGYVSQEYFCGRKTESQNFIQEITNGNNLALISTRRMEKAGLIQHCFQSEGIRKNYYTFFVDIYATKSLRDFVFSLSKVILEGLKPFGKKALQHFWESVKSLQASVAFDINGNPSLNLGLGDIQAANTTLDEIFHYLNNANKPCIVAIDEFQQIANYEEDNMEALLRTYIQHCNNAHFIFAGSQRHVMGNIFMTASRPFYQSVSMMHLESIPLPEYVAFAQHHFESDSKQITSSVIEDVYNRFEGITWYMQKMLHTLYNMTSFGSTCDVDMLDEALESVVDSFKYTYSEILFRMPEKQKELLIAITKEGKAQSITSGAFIKKYKLASASSVQSALKGLLEKDFITHEQGIYQIYDRFFGIWLKQNY